MRDVRVGYSFESPAYKYKLMELIGDGGYGRVFEATATPKNNEKKEKIEPKTTSTTAAATKDEKKEKIEPKMTTTKDEKKEKIEPKMTTTKDEPKDNVGRVAVKIEPRTTSTVIEVQVLLLAAELGCRRIPKIFDHVSSSSKHSIWE
jgi:hypothetical protein